jgi:hypothetical protein
VARTANLRTVASGTAAQKAAICRSRSWSPAGSSAASSSTGTPKPLTSAHTRRGGSKVTPHAAAARTSGCAIGRNPWRRPASSPPTPRRSEAGTSPSPPVHRPRRRPSRPAGRLPPGSPHRAARAPRGVQETGQRGGSPRSLPTIGPATAPRRYHRVHGPSGERRQRRRTITSSSKCRLRAAEARRVEREHPSHSATPRAPVPPPPSRARSAEPQAHASRRRRVRQHPSATRRAEQRRCRYAARTAHFRT